MPALPIIVGFGGISPAGRSSLHHAYRRLVYDQLPETVLSRTWEDLAELMGLPKVADFKEQRDGRVHCSLRDAILAGTLIRNRKGESQGVVAKQERHSVSSAGLLPHGFDARRYYRSAHHPKALAMTVFGASDAMNSTGLDWAWLRQRLPADQIAVYAGSSLGQLDDESGRGLMQSHLKGGRVSTKMLPFSFSEMPADFINSYVMNSLGMTGNCAGACATFLYNLRLGVQDIVSGRAQMAMVGSAEAPLVPEVIAGFESMGALANDARLRDLAQSAEMDCRTACRPFSDNAGFVLGESAQFLVLMSDTLALEVGATIYGSVPEVFVHADGNKTSISSPGVGNYLTMGKAAALGRDLLGKEGLRRTFVQAHGTGTPQNRTTESHILNETARAFGLERWPVTAMKAYLGHPLGPAAGDQLIMSLGVWEHGILPGIHSIDHLAEDVEASHLDILMKPLPAGTKGEDFEGALINSKGFGGNNASTLLLSPARTRQMLLKRFGSQRVREHEQKNLAVQTLAMSYDTAAAQGNRRIYYSFGESVMGPSDVRLTSDQITVGGFPIPLTCTHPYGPYIE